VGWRHVESFDPVVWILEGYGDCGVPRTCFLMIDQQPQSPLPSTGPVKYFSNLPARLGQEDRGDKRCFTRRDWCLKKQKAVSDIRFLGETFPR
jgi:hypothetical protein